MYGTEDPSRRPAVDAGRLWAGGLATAFVAALVAIAGVLLARGLFDASIVAPDATGGWGPVSGAEYAAGAALLSFAATGLMHVLILFTPRPMRFFGWTASLGTVVATVAPFVSATGLRPTLLTAGLNLVLGIAIGTLVAGTARSAMNAAAVSTS